MKSYLVHAPDIEVFAMASLYHDGTSALILVDANGERVATASTNLRDVILPWNQVLIKDYTENEGVLATLVNDEIVEVIKNNIVFDMNSGLTFPVATVIDKNVIRDLKKLRKEYRIYTGEVLRSG